MDAVCVSTTLTAEELALLESSKANIVTLSENACDKFAITTKGTPNNYTVVCDSKTDDGYAAFTWGIPTEGTIEEFIKRNFNFLSKLQKAEAILKVKAEQLTEAQNKMLNNVNTVTITGA